MIFNSISYAIFFPIVVILYFALPKKFKNIHLLLASYFFYGCWNVKYAALMLLSTVITYLAARLMDSYGKKKVFLSISFILNLGILFVFKYYGFFIDIFNRISGGNSSTAALFILPVGISFYTFQALGYTMDVYRGDIKAERNFITYALFVSFFPQLVAGPIERSKNLLPQIRNQGEYCVCNLVEGLILIFYGLFLKLVIADRAAIYVNTVFGSMDFKGTAMMLGALLFSIQIYCDFYSYSIMAKGSAKVMGIDLMDNFREPFLAVSIVDFWRRWHISLSTWFKDYLYIPLGGSRNGKFRHYVNIMIVFLVSGLWHGANYTFLMWGLIHGILNIISHFISRLKTGGSFISRNISRLVTFILVVLAFVFFRAEKVSDAFTYISRMFRQTGAGVLEAGLNAPNLYVLLIALLILFVVDVLKYNKIDVKDKFMHSPTILKGVVFFALIMVVVIFGIYGVGFSESMFIYFQF